MCAAAYWLPVPVHVVVWTAERIQYICDASVLPIACTRCARRTSKCLSRRQATAREHHACMGSPLCPCACLALAAIGIGITELKARTKEAPEVDTYAFARDLAPAVPPSIIYRVVPKNS